MVETIDSPTKLFDLGFAFVAARLRLRVLGPRNDTMKIYIYNFGEKRN
jgi:hypothetical protein